MVCTTAHSRPENNHQTKLKPFTTINPLYELSLIWHFTKRDLVTIPVPGVIYSASAWIYSGHYLYKAIVPLLLSVVYFTCVLLFFNVSNQLCDIEEDRIDKPDRPIVSGMVSRQGARLRLVLYGAIALIIAHRFFKLPIVWYTVTYFIGTIINNHFTAKLFWTLRTSMTAYGATIPVVMGWSSVAPVPKAVWIWFLFLMLNWCVLGPLQDLRDLDGDRKVGRRTLPLIYGEDTTKEMIRLGGLVLAVVFHYVLKNVARPGLLTAAYELIMSFMSIALTNRAWNSASAKEYNTVYKLFGAYYGLMLLSGSVLILS